MENGVFEILHVDTDHKTEEHCSCFHVVIVMVYSSQTSKSLCQKSSFSDVLGVVPKSNLAVKVKLQIVKSVQIFSTSSNLKMFGTEEKTKNVVLVPW